ncbi:MAG: Gfo/Idh/MocA family oxidoreductase [Candidatus Omnitrophica bacterium]|nr:Gfo/Idh/MocA family oxidoreductase [Candidatus Omnitrophota bacterium]
MRQKDRINQPTRREFLKTTASAAVAASISRRAFGANERIGIGMIGLHGIGGMHLGQYAKMDDVDIVALCDVDQSVRERAASTLDKKPMLTSDFRDLLDMKEVDAIVAAVPDHWHANMAIRAFEAGKDAYIEKPLAHNIREGKLIREAAEKHGRIMQTGLQQRSAPHWIHAVERIKNGEIGKVHAVHMWNAWNRTEMRGDMGKPPEAPIPDGVDYNMWLGPAPAKGFNPAHFHDYWYFFWDYSGGMVSGWGVHLFDIVQWAMGSDIRGVTTEGGNYVLDDLRDTPDTSVSVFDCPEYTLHYTVRHGNGWRPHGDMDHGIQFIGTDGVLEINRRRYQVFRESYRDSRIPDITEPRYNDGGEGGGGYTAYRIHKRNFLDCMRSRKETAAPPQVGHIASIPGHLANISYRLGRTVHWDPKNETITGDPEAEKMMTREYRRPWAL